MNNQKIISKKLTKVDLKILIILSVCVWIMAASSLGFLSAGFDSPYSYQGADDFSILSQTKELLQETWVWNTDRLGAPYSHEMLEYPSICLQIPEFIMLKFWGIFTKNVLVAVNLQFVFTFVLCSISAYVVLRKMNVGYVLSVGGAVLYAFSPYLYGRHIGHYCLTACYFIPASVYLCYCSYFDGDFLKFNKGFVCKKNLLIILMCFCIATNGIGYYPFFTCFYLCITALCKIINTGKWKDVIPAIKVIIIICMGFVLALLPVAIHKIVSGTESITIRTPADIEIYSLKITQLFVPMYSHGIAFVQNFINEYNSNMPLVNENMTSYLGIVGCAGFLISILFILGIKKGNSEDEDVLFLSKLNLMAVIFMSIGGFISLLAVAFRIYGLRGFNRISIFIAFCSISIVCLLAQKKIFEKIKFNTNYKKRKIVHLIAVGIVIFGIWDQTPQLYSNGERLKANRDLWENDKAFISSIEDQLQPGDMVYQLPYHKYPEAGVVNEMNDYQLLVGYIHSETLKWSYGGLKGGAGDRWNEYVSQLDISTMIDTIISSGFKGIYIESRAYAEEELNTLLTSIEAKIGYRPSASDDGKLYFFNLYPYINTY